MANSITELDVNKIMAQFNAIITYSVTAFSPNARVRVLNVMHQFLRRVGIDGLLVLNEDGRFDVNSMTLIEIDKCCGKYKPIGFIDVECGEIIIYVETHHQRIIVSDNDPYDCSITVENVTIKEFNKCLKNYLQ